MHACGIHNGMHCMSKLSMARVEGRANNPDHRTMIPQNPPEYAKPSPPPSRLMCFWLHCRLVCKGKQKSYVFVSLYYATPPPTRVPLLWHLVFLLSSPPPSPPAPVQTPPLSATPRIGISTTSNPSATSIMVQWSEDKIKADPFL